MSESPPLDDLRARLLGARLYLLATRAFCRGPIEDVVDAACRGGVDIVQVREKSARDSEVAALVRALLPVVRARGGLLLVNDRVAVAAECEADGAHVGPADVSPEEARRILGPRGLMGVTTHGLAQARRAVASGADYIGIGPVFPTETKGVPVRAIGEEAAGSVATAVAPLVAFAIGGIAPENIARVAGAGLRRIAVCRAILEAENPEEVARRLVAGLTLDRRGSPGDPEEIAL